MCDVGDKLCSPLDDFSVFFEPARTVERLMPS
mgnify:CR=1 FL=1|jgi:hypothetical protein